MCLRCVGILWSFYVEFIIIMFFFIVLLRLVMRRFFWLCIVFNYFFCIVLDEYIYLVCVYVLVCGMYFVDCLLVGCFLKVVVSYNMLFVFINFCFWIEFFLGC